MLHATQSWGPQLHFASWCAEVMQDSTTCSFRPLLIVRGKKNKHPGNNLCTGYHTPVKTKQVINLTLKQCFSFQCQTYEQWAINYCRGQRGETGRRQTLHFQLCRATYLWKEPGTIHLPVPDCSGLPVYLQPFRPASCYQGSGLCYCTALLLNCKP